MTKPSLAESVKVITVREKCLLFMWGVPRLPAERFIHSVGYIHEEFSQGPMQLLQCAWLWELSLEQLGVSLASSAAPAAADLMGTFCRPFAPVASAAGPPPGSALQAWAQRLIKNCWCEMNNRIFFS